MAVFPSSMPYDEVSIFDQSQYIEEQPADVISTVPTGPIMFCPFISERGYGEDNKLMYMNGARLAKYGTPNLKKYGLSLYLANRFLAAGGSILGMRVMPDSATKAQVLVYAEVQETSDMLPVTSSVAGNEKFVRFEVHNSAIELANDTIYHNYNNADDGLYVSEITNEATGDKTYTKYMGMDAGIDGDHILVAYDGTTGGAKVKLKGGSSATTVGLIVSKSLDNFTLPAESTVDEKTTKYVLGGKTGETAKTAYPNLYIYAKSIVTSENITTITYTPILSAERVKATVPYTTEIKIATGEDAKTITNCNKDELSDTHKAHTFKLFTISAKAAGKFANAFKFRIIADEVTTDRLNDQYFIYNFIDSDNGNKLDNTITFSFNDDCKYDSEYIDIDSVFDEYSENIVMKKDEGFDLFREYIEAGIEKYAPVLSTDGVTPLTFDAMDILFGTNTQETFYRVTKDVNNNSILSMASGINLVGGKDGWTTDASDTVEFRFEEATDVTYNGDPFAAELVKAYDGTKSDLIFDEVRYPFEFMYAPSTDNALMTAMMNLTKNDSNDARRITHVEFFTPKFETHTDAQNWMAKCGDIKEFRQYFCHSWAQIRDPYTNKKVYMPAVYFDSYGECSVWLRNPGTPYAGEKNYRWDNFIVGSLVPASSRRDYLIKNHNAGLNTMIEDGNGYASPYEQITAQQRAGITSELSEKNNVFTLCEMVRIALRIANENRWGSLTDTDISNYKTIVENAISVQLGNCYEQMEVLAERQAVNGAGRKRIRCKINVLFNSMLKGVSYEFYILANA